MGHDQLMLQRNKKFPWAWQRRALVGAACLLLGSQSLDAQEPFRGMTGLAITAGPVFDGSGHREIKAMPLVILSYRNFYAGGSEFGLGAGVGVHIPGGDSWTSSFECSVTPPRWEHKDPHYLGMGNRKEGCWMNLGVSARAGSGSFKSGLGVGLRDQAGWLWLNTLGWGSTLGTMTVELKGELVASSRTNMTYDFGVSAQQASRRQALFEGGAPLDPHELGPYSPGGGLKRGSIGLALRGPGRHGTMWIASMDGHYLFQQAASSPLVKERFWLTAGLGMTWSF